MSERPDADYALDMIVSSLNRIESLLDQLVTVAEDIEDSTAETAFYTHGPFWRWRAHWRHAGNVIEQAKAEVNAAHFPAADADPD
jgi:hypothetical protein